MIIFSKIWLGLFLFVSFLFIYSCSKDSSSSPTEIGNNNNKLTAQISGSMTKSFNAIQTVYIYQAIGSEMSQSVITGYEGNQNQSDNIMLQLINLVDGAQTIDLGLGLGTLMYVKYNNGSAQQYLATEGTVNITQNDSKSIKGTFSAKIGTVGTSTYIEINNGSFCCDK